MSLGGPRGKLWSQKNPTLVGFELGTSVWDTHTMTPLAVSKAEVTKYKNVALRKPNLKVWRFAVDQDNEIGQHFKLECYHWLFLKLAVMCFRRPDNP